MYRRKPASLYNNRKSYCEGVAAQGSPESISRKWDELSEQAAKEGDRVKAERFRQNAEHYRKGVDCS